MTMMSTMIDKVVHLSADRVERLAQLARQHDTSEDALVEKALDLLFSLTEGDDEEERRLWQAMTMKSLARVWDNEADAVYDNWRELPERGIDETQAADLRARLQAFAEDWERPEMEAYDAL
jgi:hypothetical protein